MSPVSSSRRAGSRLTLRTRSADDVDDPFDDSSGDSFTPWPIAALIAGFGSALFGWILITGVVAIGWLSARSDALQGALRTGTHFWLLANGAGLSLDGERWTLMPLAVTLVLVLMISGMSGIAVRQALLPITVQAGRGGTPATRQEAGRAVRNVTVVASLAYLISVTVTASIVGTSNQGGRALVGSLLIGLVSSWWGASRAAGYRVVDGLPEWLRPVPAAVQAALLTMVIAGAAVFTATIVIRFDQINELAAGLGLNAFSGLFVLLAQAMFLPNFLLWSGSWALGAGFRVGVDSIVSPTNTNLGLQPWVPIFGALPDEGPGSLWSLLWLLSGVVAGMLAAVQVMRRRPRARFDETALVGGLAGVLAGLVYTLIAAVSGGDLGNGRLMGMGPRLTELAVMSGSLMGISGLATGLIWGLIRRPATAEQPEGDDTSGDADEEDTAVVGAEAPADSAGAAAAEDEETAVVADRADTAEGRADRDAEDEAEDEAEDDEVIGTPSDEPTRDLAKLADEEETVEVDRSDGEPGARGTSQHEDSAGDDEPTEPVRKDAEPVRKGADPDDEPTAPVREDVNPDDETTAPVRDPDTPDPDGRASAAGANDEQTIVIEDEREDANENEDTDRIGEDDTNR